MKKNTMLNRILSCGLALALFVASPVSVIADDVAMDAPVETTVENTSESQVASEGESEAGETPAEDKVSESDKASADDAGQTKSDDSTSDDVSENKEVNTDDARAGATVDKSNENKKSDEEAAETEDADKEEDAESEKSTEEEADEADDEIEYSYDSNGDGTHTKSWIDEDGEKHEETEDCQYDEDGVCELCGYEKEADEEDDEEVTLTFSDDEVVVTVVANKSVLNGATDVKAEKIEKNDDRYKDIETSLTDSAEESGKELLAFLAYDISLIDDEGNVVEPDKENGKVSVKIEKVTAPSSDDEIKTADVEVTHFEEASSEISPVNITDEDSTIIDKGTDASTLDVAFEIESFSAFSISWLDDKSKVGTITWTDGTNSKIANIYIVDENGKGLSKYIQSSKLAYSLAYNQNLSNLGLNAINDDFFAAIANQISIIGYEYDSAYACDQDKTAQEIENLHYYYGLDVNGNVSEGWAYYLSTNAEDNFYYFNLGENATIGSLTENEIRICLEYKEVETSTVDFKVDLFQYDDNWFTNFNNVGYTAINYASYLKRINDKYLEMNFGSASDDYNVNHYEGAYQGLADAKLDSNGMISFSSYGTPGYFTTTDNNKANDDGYYTGTSTVKDSSENSKVYNSGYYNVTFPFTKSGDYYSFDSSSQSAKFNKSSGKVTVTNNAGSNGFWPFGNDAGDADHFGMHFTTDFYMTTDGQVDGKDCVFKFSGDDDVWVYVDGVLVLDLGGIHDEVSGTIDFASGDVNVSKVYHSSGQGTSYNMYTTNTLGKSSILNNGVHTLQVYYLERGSTASNCSIAFNLPTISDEGDPIDVSFTKRNSQSGLNLQGAEFELYDLNGNIVGSKVTSGEDGLVKFENVAVGEYTLKETKAADKYILSTSEWKVKVYYVNGEGKFDITSDDEDASDLEYDSEVGYIIYNTPSGDSTIFADKTAEVLNWEDRTYKITLSGNALVEDYKTSKADVVLVIDVSGSMLFPNDLQESGTYSISGLDTKKTYYYVTSDKAATVYTVKYQNSKWQYRDASYVYQNSGTDWADITNKSNVLTTTGSYKFYLSPSDGKSIRFDDTKAAAKAFIKVLAEQNPENRVSIVTFAGKNATDYTKVQAGLTKLSSENVTTLNSTIDSLKTTGGTNQYAGLDLATKTLNDRRNKNNRKSAIVLISDGTINETVSDTDVTNSIADAKKAANKVYTVGIDLDFSDKVKESAGALLNGISSSGSYINAGQSGLKSFLTGIAYDILNIGGSNGSVIDEIDNRFYLVDSSGNEIAVGSTVTAYVIKNSVQTAIQGTVKEASNGTIYIEWNTDSLIGFYAEFYVKAKDDFMGGNVITTNGSGSKISSGTKYKNFPQPTVNVRLFDLGLDNNEITVLLGDELQVVNYVEYLLSTLTCFDGTSDNYKSGVLSGIHVDASALFDDDASNDYIEYSYHGDGDVVGKLYLILTKNDKAQATNIANEVGDDVYVYTLNVKYEAESYDSRKASVVNGNVTAPNDSDLKQGYKLVSDEDALTTNKTSIKTAEGKYIVNVVDAGILVTKLAASDLNKKLVGAKYLLSASELNGYTIDTLDATLTSDENGLMKFNGLGVGTFTLKETNAPNSSNNDLSYALSKEEFTISIKKTGLGVYSVYVYSSNNSKEPLTVQTFDVSNELMGSNNTYETPEAHIVKFNVTDQVLYTLPKTGGSGVYVYTIGGILLMIAGALLLYKNKNNKKQ